MFDSEACDVLRHFVNIKCELMPYIYGQSIIAHRTGVPVMRPMLLEFPDDPACHTPDTQYMLGESLLVAPVFSKEGEVCYYLPQGRWTNYITNEVVEGGSYKRERHDYFSLPVMVRPNTVLISGARNDKPDYNYADGMTVNLYELAEDCCHVVEVPDVNGDTAVTVTVKGQADILRVSIDKPDIRWFLKTNDSGRAKKISGGTYDADKRHIVCKGLSVIIE
jgi:alpha-D-xyloside xylohydrolase